MDEEGGDIAHHPKARVGDKMLELIWHFVMCIFGNRGTRQSGPLE